jgi:hypothetical protein
MTYQDSVETITGIPKGGVHYVDPRILHILGANSAVVGRYYGGPIDTALLDKQYKGNPTDDEHKLVLAHELGHRVDFLNTDPRMMAAFDSARAVNPAPNPMDYAATSHQEHFAEAFGRAMLTLSYMSDPEVVQGGAPLARQWFRDAERSVPGTLAIMKQIMDKPLYANHPMQKYKGMMSLPYKQIDGQ